MSVTFSHVWAVPAMIAAAVSLVTLLIAMFVTRRRSRNWRVICVILPGLASLAVSLAIASPALLFQHRASNVVILLDLSGSTRASPWRDPAWVRRLAQRRLDPGATVSVVGFSGAVQLLLDQVHADDAPRWPSVWPTIDPDNRSDLAAAFGWRSAGEARHEEPLAPRWLITDGLSPFPFPSGETFSLALTDIAPPANDPDVAITNLLRLPNGELNIQLRATGPATAIVDVQRDHQPLAHQSIRFTEPNGSSRWLTIQDPLLRAAGLAPEPHRYDVSIHRTPSPDLWPENDRASLLWTPAAPPRILIVSNTAPATAPELASFSTATIKPSAFPPDVASLLASDWQVIVLDNIPLVSESPAMTLSPQQLATLDPFVRVTGGGLLLRGTSHAFGPGHYDDSENPLATLSPVFSGPPDRPRAHIIFLVDASGSMNESAGGMEGATPDQKFRLASRGILGALDQLHANDQLTVLAFNNATQRIAVGTKETLAPRLADLLAQVQPTGSTVPDTALPEITNAFARKSSEEPALLILLTDGEIPSMDAARWQSVMRSAGATLTVVAPATGASPASDSLAALADSLHAQWLPTKDATQWPLLLRRALADRFAGREHTAPLAWHSVNLNPPMQGITTRWTDVWRKPEALNLAVAQPNTLAAIAQRGLGKVAALAMENDSSPMLAPILQQLAPPPGDRRFTLAARRENDGWTLTVDALNTGQFLNGLQLRAGLLSSNDAATMEIAFQQSGPGTYEARVESPDPLTAIVVERGEAGDHFVGRLQFPRVEVLEWPASVEGIDRFAVPSNVKIISADESVVPRWSPQIEGWRMPLSLPLWLIAITLLLLSLLIGRSG